MCVIAVHGKPWRGERQKEKPFEGDQPVPAAKYLKNKFRDDSTHHTEDRDLILGSLGEEPNEPPHRGHPGGVGKR